MTTTNTIHEMNDERLHRQLSARYTKLGQRIAELADDQTDPFSDRLRQIVAAHQREVARKLDNNSGSACYLERVMTYRLAAILQLHKRIGLLQEKLDRNERSTSEERRALKSLETAIASFTYAINRLSPKIGHPTFSDDRLAALLWFNFTNVTAAEAEKDAADIIALLRLSQPVQ